MVQGPDQKIDYKSNQKPDPHSAAKAMPSDSKILKLTSQIQYVKGVGPKLGALLSKHGVRTVRDLLEFYPRAYEDRRAARNILSLQENETVSLVATVANVYQLALGRSQRKMYDITLKDASGSIHCKFFRTPYRGYFERFQKGTEVRVIGKVMNYRGKIEFHHPELRPLTEESETEEQQDQLIPIYTEIEGLASSKIRKMIQSAFEGLNPEEFNDDYLPEEVRQKHKMMTWKDAIQTVHAPQIQNVSAEGVNKFIEGKSNSHFRLKYDEFFWLEIFLATRKSEFAKEESTAIPNDEKMMEVAIQNLPFELTKAQVTVLKEVQADLAQPHPMNRLVQGDVGSGKTIVSFLAALQVIQAGFQVALMAPTEILAEQHFKNAEKFFGAFGKKAAFLAGKTKTSERNSLFEELQSGEISILIGTHALIEDEVVFKHLALVIVDEQHRFGVNQRAKLKSKGLSPHFLVMTATPIPRTLALTVYGDLDVSTMRELPKGRSPIQTRVVYQTKRQQAVFFMLDQIKKGRQAYFVYPLVEESEKIDLKNAVEEYEKLKNSHPEFKFDLLHGKMKSDEKEQIMDRYRKGETQILVSTTVIEVGVDVPNANIILIEHAERFGLSQLHQLRGRVGRGQHKSFCVLIMGYAVSEESKDRCTIMEKTTDGFEVAEHDLEIRGPGQFLGTRQSGLTGFKLAHLIRDQEIMMIAREDAFLIVKNDPDLKLPEHAKMKLELSKTNGTVMLAGVS
jgi:ATP-dependent DNA helicase RecG